MASSIDCHECLECKTNGTPTQSGKFQKPEFVPTSRDNKVIKVRCNGTEVPL